ncbi:LRRC8 [Lepeophtheirus salmonis]|uniref:LRRC8 n=1 Tax=Lepeophtheirus salmonis TaxID=72036 RepID=A0A7R8CME5_LEPSM|nr:LRRC8 [Lepeophtheirus salmonis]CAF2836863.1 LRRC8 [Lepeophtheirus salmonis]
MASLALESDVRKSLLDRTEAEKAFRPWWDTLEDTLLNTLIAFGFLTLPTAYVTGNPVECVLHPDIWNKSKIFDPMRVKQIDFYDDNDEYNEENSGYPINTVST